MTERDEYTPSVDEAQMFYEAGRSAMRRAATGEQIIDIGPFTAEFDRMIEAVRAEEREKAAQMTMTNFALRGLRPEGECGACDYAREGWQKAIEEGR